MKLTERHAWVAHDAPSVLGGIDLLRNRQPHAPLRACDGNVAAYCELAGNQYIITSNARYIPLPPDIDNKHITLRSDMRFGSDDPVLWPQLFTPTYPHLGAIPKAPINASHAAEIGVMWWDPAPADFVTGMSITRTLGKLANSRLVELAAPVHALLDRYKKYVQSCTNGIPPSPLLPQLAQCLQLSLERLQDIPATYTRMRLNVTAVQRHFLELTGMLQYFAVYKPRMDDPASERRTPDDCVGVFTQDPEIAQLFALAGLPYWFIRPFTAFAGENILRVIEPLAAQDFLAMDAALDFSPIPTTARLEDRLRALTLFTRATPWYTNPFLQAEPVDGSSASCVSGSLPAPTAETRVPTGSRTHKTKVLSPYAEMRLRKKAEKAMAPPNPAAKAARDKYIILDSPEMPTPIGPWADALAKVDRTHLPACGADRPQLYVLPEPALLASAADTDRRRVYYHHYRLLRDALMYRLAVPDVPHPLLTTQQWRDLLLGKVVKQGKVGSRLLDRTLRIEDLLAPAMKACGIDALADFPVPTEATPPINIHRVQELLWELAEMNFRYEFLALDAKASGLDRPDACRTCFASTALMGVDFADSQRGLAALAAMERLPYLLNMAALMADWRTPCPRPQEIDQAKTKTDWERTTVRMLERRVTTYYTQTFYDLFGRAAVIPMRLEHDFGS